MGVNLKGRSFLTLMDFTPAEIRYMLDLAHDLKAKKRLGIKGNYCFLLLFALQLPLMFFFGLFQSFRQTGQCFKWSELFCPL